MLSCCSRLKGLLNWKGSGLWRRVPVKQTPHAADSSSPASFLTLQWYSSQMLEWAVEVEQKRRRRRRLGNLEAGPLPHTHTHTADPPIRRFSRPVEVRMLRLVRCDNVDGWVHPDGSRRPLKQEVCVFNNLTTVH